MNGEVVLDREDWQPLLEQLRNVERPVFHVAYKALFQSAQRIGKHVLERFRWLGSARDRMSDDVFWRTSTQLLHVDAGEAMSFFIISLRAEAVRATHALLASARAQRERLHAGAQPRLTAANLSETLGR